jgi:hypothetical protein
VMIWVGGLFGHLCINYTQHVEKLCLKYNNPVIVELFS